MTRFSTTVYIKKLGVVVVITVEDPYTFFNLSYSAFMESGDFWVGCGVRSWSLVMVGSKAMGSEALLTVRNIITDMVRHTDHNVKIRDTVR